MRHPHRLPSRPSLSNPASPPASFSPCISKEPTTPDYLGLPRGGIPPFQQAKRPPRSSAIRAHSMQGCDTTELAPSTTHCRLGVGSISGENFSPGCLRPWLFRGYVRTRDGIGSSVLENQWRWRPAKSQRVSELRCVRSELSSLGCCVPSFGCRARAAEWLIFNTAFRLLCL